MSFNSLLNTTFQVQRGNTNTDSLGAPLSLGSGSPKVSGDCRICVLDAKEKVVLGLKAQDQWARIFCGPCVTGFELNDRIHTANDGIFEAKGGQTAFRVNRSTHHFEVLGMQIQSEVPRVS